MNGVAGSWRIAATVALALCCAILVARPAQAQQNPYGLPSFFHQLFGGFGPRAAPPDAGQRAPLRERAHKTARKKQDFVSSTKTRAPGSPGGAPVAPTFFVTVLGDSLAILAAQGLTDAFADNRQVAITSLARDVSGLTRDDYYDWPKATRDLIASKPKIDVAVIMMGINDVQPMKDGADMLDPLSDKWRAAYTARVDAMLAPLRGANIPVLWVGLPPMRDERLNAQAIALNEIYRDRAAKAGATYVDIWDAFADSNGQYAAFGPDADGQNAKLRDGPGGIYLTKIGARKVAQLLEPELRRDIDKMKPEGGLAGLPPDIAREASAINEEMQREKDADAEHLDGAVPVPKSLVGPIVSLTALPAATGGALVNAADAAVFKTIAEQAIGAPAGATPAPPPGRADNFAWPTPK